MPDLSEMKTQADNLMTNLKAIQESNLEIKTHQDGASDERKSLGEKVGTQQAAIADMQVKFDAFETAQARKSELQSGQIRSRRQLYPETRYVRVFQSGVSERIPRQR